MPVIETSLRSPDPSQRSGVIFGLGEVVKSVHKKQVSEFLDAMLPAVRAALCDPEEEVRDSAAATFSTFHSKAVLLWKPSCQL